MTRTALGLAGALLLAAPGCTAGESSSAGRSAPPPAASSPGAASGASGTPTGSPTASPSATSTLADPPARFDAASAMADVRRIAGLGPREATSDSYARAADLVADRFAELGYTVRRQRLRVPAGVSWGIPVRSGRTASVVAEPPGFEPDRRHRLVGAHLDTVPQAPGADDNASGVAVILELARMASAQSPRVPVVFVAFAAEEPRGPGDAGHHFGSRTYVARRSGSAPAEVVSLDRVGIAGRVPVCSGGLGSPAVRRALLAAADRVGVPAFRCLNRTSDHWPFERAGVPAARVGGNDHPAYHTAGDLPRVVDPRQLARTGRIVWEWLNRRG